MSENVNKWRRYYKIRHVYAYMTREQYISISAQVKVIRQNEAVELLLEDNGIGFCYNKNCTPVGR